MNTKLDEIIELKGMCIYGTSDLHDKSEEIKKAFRYGSSKAYDECAKLAEQAKAEHGEALYLLCQIINQYSTMPDGPLGNGFTNEYFLKAKVFLKSIGALKDMRKEQQDETRS